MSTWVAWLKQFINIIFKRNQIVLDGANVKVNDKNSGSKWFETYGKHHSCPYPFLSKYSKFTPVCSSSSV